MRKVKIIKKWRIEMEKAMIWTQIKIKTMINKILSKKQDKKIPIHLKMIRSPIISIMERKDKKILLTKINKRMKNQKKLLHRKTSLFFQKIQKSLKILFLKNWMIQNLRTEQKIQNKNQIIHHFNQWSLKILRSMMKQQIQKQKTYIHNLHKENLLNYKLFYWKKHWNKNKHKF